MYFHGLKTPLQLARQDFVILRLFSSNVQFKLTFIWCEYETLIIWVIIWIHSNKYTAIFSLFYVLYSLKYTTWIVHFGKASSENDKNKRGIAKLVYLMLRACESVSVRLWFEDWWFFYIKLPVMVVDLT